MAFIRVDIERVRADTAAAEHRLEAASDRRKQAEAQLQEALDEEGRFRQEAEFARLVEVRILAAAENEAETPEAPVADEAVESVDGPTSEGPYVSMTTRMATLDALRSNPGRTFALDELVNYMKERGFTGTHNAVHVQLSRLIGTPEAEDVERVKTGHYRAVAADPIGDDRFAREGDISLAELRDQGVRPTES